MDAKKLMYGDLVYYRHELGLSIGVVRGIGIGKVAVENSIGVVSSFLQQEIEPIPLTEELFEKIGFKKCTDFPRRPFTNYESEDKRIQISDCSNMGDVYWYVHIDNEDMETIGGCDVKYLHHMQQLFRLCDYEFEPNL